MYPDKTKNIYKHLPGKKKMIMKKKIMIMVVGKLTRAESRSGLNTARLPIKRSVKPSDTYIVHAPR